MSDSTETPTGRPVTGRMVLIIALSAFAVILAANLTLLFSATGSFPGLIVKNSYVASQGWDARTQAQRALGWKTVVGYRDGTLSVQVAGSDGTAVEGLAPTLLVGRPASSAEDQTLTARAGAEPGIYSADITLAPGIWRVSITAESAEGQSYAAGAELLVPEPR